MQNFNYNYVTEAVCKNDLESTAFKLQTVSDSKKIFLCSMTLKYEKKAQRKKTKCYFS